MRSVVSNGPSTAPRLKTRAWRSRPAILLAVALVAIVGYLAYDRFLKPQAAAAPAQQPVTVSRGTIVATVSSTGSVVPTQTAELAFKTSGQITELNVSVGQTVKKGDVLARLDTTDLRLAVLDAEAKLASAESNLATLEAGSTPAEIAQARAQLQSAQATLDKLKAGPTTADLQSAEASVASARSQLQKAESDLADLKAGPSQTEIANAQVAIERARITLQNAQAAYDKVAWRPDVGSTPEAMTLWQATTDYQAAKAAYDEAMAGPTEEDLAIAEQNVVSARAQLAVAEDKLATLKAGATAEELASAEAAVLQAQLQLEQKLNPTTEAELKAARAAVEQARVGLESARSNLEQAALVAPFDGVVAEVNGAVGQTASGTVVTLLDLSAPQMQISLPETDVAKVEVGQRAILTLDALGGQQLMGRVLSITPRATVSQGVATYTALVGIVSTPQRGEGGAPNAGQSDQPGSDGSGQPSTGQSAPGTQGESAAGQGRGSSGGLRSGAWAGASQRSSQQTPVDLSKVRPGMTASVSIIYLQKSDVLVVPNRAIRAQGRERVVDVLVDGKVETRVVTVGAADDQRTEIVEGLQEGDQVVIATTTTTTSTQTTGGTRVFVPGGMPGGFQGGFPR